MNPTQIVSRIRREYFREGVAGVLVGDGGTGRWSKTKDRGGEKEQNQHQRRSRMWLVIQHLSARKVVNERSPGPPASVFARPTWSRARLRAAQRSRARVQVRLIGR